MRLHTATAGEHDSGNDPAVITHPSRKRSSPFANAVALFCAWLLLAIALWTRRGLLLHSGSRLYLIVAVTVGFALAARRLRGVSTSGALAGATVAFIMASRDLRLFWILLIVFLITLAATRAGTARKRALKVAEAAGGRSASQVMANLGVTTAALTIPALVPGYLMALAALAELAADTTSSEIGSAFSAKTILITSGKSVPPGTDGGISLLGTVAGGIASLLTAACAAILGLLPAHAAAIAGCAGVGGMLADSMLGAALERRGYLNNDLVNLLSTATAAIIAWLCSP
jgi:uncharacterized protein (TIGR00297 family)